MYNVTGKARARNDIKTLQKGSNNFKYLLRFSWRFYSEGGDAAEKPPNV